MDRFEKTELLRSQKDKRQEKAQRKEEEAKAWAMSRLSLEYIAEHVRRENVKGAALTPTEEDECTTDVHNKRKRRLHNVSSAVTPESFGRM